MSQVAWILLHMGYGGKIAEQTRARDLRVTGWTMPAIAAELGVARSSVSLWVRHVPYIRPARTGANRGPNRLQQAKAAEIERLRAEGAATIGQLSEREFLVAGLALYVGEGAKRDGDLALANTDPRVVGFFWPGFGNSSTSTKRGCEHACTSTLTWTSTRRWRSGSR